MVLAGTPFVPETKSPGDLIESAEWNAATKEIKRLEAEKLNRKGADTLQGPLTIEQALRVGNVSAETLATLPDSSRLTVANSNTDLVNVWFQKAGGGQLEFRCWELGWSISSKTANTSLWINRDADTTSNVYIGTWTKDLFYRGSDGNVAISLKNRDPEAKLDIGGVAAATATSGTKTALSLRGGNGANATIANNQITFGYNNGQDSPATGKYRHVIQTRHNGGSKSGNAIDFYVWKYGDSAETIGTLHTMTLDGGNVGIGTTSPQAKLQVIDASTTAGSGTTFVLGPTTASNLRLGYHQDYSWIQSHGNKPLAINPTGNVGIGTTDPKAKLQVSGGKLQLDGDQQLVFTDSGTSNKLKLQLWDGYGLGINGSTLFYTAAGRHSWRDNNSAEKMALTTAENGGLTVNGTGNSSFAGNLGIGTTTPSAKLHVDGNAVVSNGNVGIGTTIPQAKLHVNGAGGTTVEMIVNGRIRSSGTYPGLSLGDDKRCIGGEDTGKVGFYNEGWHLTVLNNGNVGIGTNNPKTSLDISKNAANALGPILTLSNTGGGGSAGVAIDFNSYNIAAQGAYDPAARIRSFDNNWSSHLAFLTKVPGAAANPLQERLRIQNDGNVGIGTTTPGAKLHVNGNTIIDGNVKATTLTVTTGNAIVTTSAGNVGIGTTTPSAKLHVIGTGGSNVDLIVNGRLKSDSDNGGLYVASDRFVGGDGTSKIGFYNKAWRLTVQDNGYVGIGTIGTDQPKALLHVNGDYYGQGNIYLYAFEGDGNSGTAYIQARDKSETSSLGLRLRTKNGKQVTDVMHLTADGNVGIGTTSPSEKLEVNGSLKILGSRIKSKDGYEIVATDQTDWLRINPKGSYPGTAFYKAVALGSEGGLVVGEWSQQGEGVLKVTKSTYLATAGGNVGIGTTSPSEKLEVHGSIRVLGDRIKGKDGYGIIDTVYDKAWLRINPDDHYEATSFNKPVAIGSGGLVVGEWTKLNSGVLKVTKSTYLATTSGNVGIGTTDPQAKLHVNGAGGTTVEMIVNGRIRSSGTYPGLSLGDDKRCIGGEATGKVGFYNEGWHLTVLNNGNVGIGTNSPQAKLQVIDASTTAGSGTTFVLGPTTASHLRLGYHQDYSWIQSHGNKPLTINPAGNNVGIGTTSPKEKLHVSGDLALGKDENNKKFIIHSRLENNGDHLQITHDKSDGNWDWGKGIILTRGQPQSGTTAAVETRVGIGTESPQAKLHVNGRIRDKNGWLMPVGSILPYAASNAPDGWLLCNGDPLNKKNNPIYQELFDVIGYQYGGSGDIFNLPDLRGRVPVGLNNRSGEAHFQSLGTKGGSKDHTLTIDEMPSHNHEIEDQGHYHEIKLYDGNKHGVVDDASASSQGQSTNTEKAQTGIKIRPKGDGRPHNNLQPYITVNYIIKY